MYYSISPINHHTLGIPKTYLDDMFSILLHLRKHNVVFTSDIKNKHRQMLVQEDGRDLQKSFDIPIHFRN